VIMSCALAVGCCLGSGKHAHQRSDARVVAACRAWSGAGLAPMQKLVLECMILQPLSASGLQELLSHTLAAAEAMHAYEKPNMGATEVATGTQPSDMAVLHACGFAALQRLNADKMVSNFKEEAPGVLRS
jgi:hypothetical protein